ncbi:EF-hand domain-containing protein [Streptomyces sp. MS1.AVA.1]|uniref:EF-hand domain-containing protein n=1 Tax=Streptomyces machairae TaxID=3134109 RepID=A0ABU8UX94_9ACTN
MDRLVLSDAPTPLPMEEQHMDIAQLDQAFRVIDANRNGFVTLAEIRSALAGREIPLDAGSLDTAFGELDKDGDGRLTHAEFSGFQMEPYKSSVGTTLAKLAA